MEMLTGPRVVVCGGRHYSGRQTLWKALDELAPSFVLHGNCPTGADKIADDWALARGIRLVRMPAPWIRYKARGGPIRNSWMLDLALELKIRIVLAAPGNEGTNDVIRKAESFGMDVRKLPA